MGSPHKQYDVFISHASEDKSGIVRDLAYALRSKRFSVWYDEFTLRVGDGLRKSIDDGLARSRYGIVVLSKAFFQKQWPQWELDGLVQRHLRDGNVILPVWHEISSEEVAEYSPPLANLVAADTSEGVEAVVAKLAAVIRPEKSSLEVAYEVMREYGADPPPISDDWWLHVAGELYYPYSIGERWRLPYPKCPDGVSPDGWELAWVGMNDEWYLEAAYQRIACTTHPSEALKFIEEMPGLEEAARASIKYLLYLIPQLAIPGLGGILENEIQKLYDESCRVHDTRIEQGNPAGSALTTTGQCPRSDEVIAIRHSSFADYRPEIVASKFCESCSADSNGLGVADVLFWLMSARSEWVGGERKAFLVKGISQWAAWGWGMYGLGARRDPDEVRAAPHYDQLGQYLARVMTS